MGCLGVNNINKDASDRICYLNGVLLHFGRFRAIPASFSSAVILLSFLLF